MLARRMPGRPVTARQVCLRGTILGLGVAAASAGLMLGLAPRAVASPETGSDQTITLKVATPDFAASSGADSRAGSDDPAVPRHDADTSADGGDGEGEPARQPSDQSGPSGQQIRSESAPSPAPGEAGTPSSSDGATAEPAAGDTASEPAATRPPVTIFGPVASGSSDRAVADEPSQASDGNSPDITEAADPAGPPASSTPSAAAPTPSATPEATKAPVATDATATASPDQPAATIPSPRAPEPSPNVVVFGLPIPGDVTSDQDDAQMPAQSGAPEPSDDDPTPAPLATATALPPNEPGGTATPTATQTQSAPPDPPAPTTAPKPDATDATIKLYTQVAPSAPAAAIETAQPTAEASPEVTLPNETPAPAAASFDEGAARQRMADVATSLVGVRESPMGCNCGTDVEAITNGRKEEWCASTVSKIVRDAGVPFDGGTAIGGVSDDTQLVRVRGDQGVEGYYRRHNAFSDPAAAVPKVGDSLIFRRGSGAGNIGHTSTIVEVSADGNDVVSVDGNSDDQVRKVDHPGFRSDKLLIGVGDPVAAWINRHPELTAPATPTPAPATEAPGASEATPAPPVVMFSRETTRSSQVVTLFGDRSQRPSRDTTIRMFARAAITSVDAAPITPAEATIPQPTVSPESVSGWQLASGTSPAVAKQFGHLVPYEGIIRESAARYDLPPALIGAVILRETSTAANVRGDGGHGRGLMQIDDRWHGPWLQSHDGGMDPASNIDYGASILRANVDHFNGEGLSPQDALRFAVAAYNAGVGGASKGLARDEPDLMTAGNDYSTEVMATWSQLEAAGIR